MKVLVTGGSGFVGEAVIEKLLAENHSITALLNQNSMLKVGGEIEKNCRILKADIRNFESLNKLEISETFDAVIHSAGLAHQFAEREEQDFWDVNVTGTENIAKLAAKFSAKHFILLSSVSVYGKSSANGKFLDREGLRETAECVPQGIYAVTKYESEKAARKICDLNRMSLTILRLATVIGENDRGNVFRLIRAIERRRFVWLGDGRNLKSLIYKGDVAQACLEVLSKPENAGTYNLTAKALTMKELVGAIYLGLNRNMPRFLIPNVWLNLFLRLNQFNNQTLRIKRLDKLSKTIHKWLSDDVFSGEKFNAAYNFQIETPIAEAIRREVESCRQAK